MMHRELLSWDVLGKALQFFLVKIRVQEDINGTVEGVSFIKSETRFSVTSTPYCAQFLYSSLPAKTEMSSEVLMSY